MDKSKSVLLYNLYPLNKWKEITDSLLSIVPHNDIVIHINIPKRNPLVAIKAYLYLKRFKKAKKIYFSWNSRKKGETIGFETFRKKINFNNYDIATYTHSKGSSRKKKNIQPIKDWTELLRYFVIERLDITKKVFSEGYFLYGANLYKEAINDSEGNARFHGSIFHYSGNFVSINLNELRKEFLNTKCYATYYGVEMFWGRLCSLDKAFEVHNSSVDHYNENYGIENYKQGVF